MGSERRVKCVSTQERGLCKKGVVYICWSENNFDEQKVDCKQKKIKVYQMFQLLYNNFVIMIVKLQLSR